MTSLFGRRAFFKRLPKVSTVTQCSKCWMWHNLRNCGKNQRCRLCGTTKHSEAFHPRCIRHSQCKLKCIHCSGPHASDDTTCQLRPKASGAHPSTENKRAIRQAWNETRIRREEDSPCSSVDTEMDPDLPTTTQNPPPQASIDSPLTAPSIILQRANKPLATTVEEAYYDLPRERTPDINHSTIL